jgi:hypothetical protein
MVGRQAAEQQSGLRTTFGKLEGSSKHVVLPSTLGYRERTELAKKHAFEYSQVSTCRSQQMSLLQFISSDILQYSILVLEQQQSLHGQLY